MDQIDRLIATIPQFKGRQFLRVPYTYQYTGASIAANGTQNGQINFQSDSVFVLQAQSAYFPTGNAITFNTLPVANVSILTTDTGSGKQLQSAAVPVFSIFGTGQFPFILPTPYLWAAKSTMTIQLANLDTATAYTPNLSFIGIKLYEIGSASF